MRHVQTYDAGVTVDQWATLLPVARDGAVHRHVFEDCAHWWALAHHCLAALEEIHRCSSFISTSRRDNICIPYAPTDFDPDASGVACSRFRESCADRLRVLAGLARESLPTPLPIGWQKDYDYQSPRLLKALEAGRAGDLEPTRELDWRCDFYSLAAMLRRYLPDETRTAVDGGQRGWTSKRYDSARTLIFRLRDLSRWRLLALGPHRGLMEVTGSHSCRDGPCRVACGGGDACARRELAAAPSLVTPLTRDRRSAPYDGRPPASLSRRQRSWCRPSWGRRERGACRNSSPGRAAEPTRPRREAARSAMLGIAAGPGRVSRLRRRSADPFADQTRESSTDLRSRFSAEPKPVGAPTATAEFALGCPLPAAKPRRLQAQPKCRSFHPGPQIEGRRRGRE